MRYAEVSVNSPIAQARSFSYGVPDDLRPDIKIGQAVWVPFGDKILQGIVIKLTPDPAVSETRDVIGIFDPLPLLFSFQIDLACWISSYYLAPLFESVALMLPPGFERRVITYYSRLPGLLNEQALTEEQQNVLAAVPLDEKVALKYLEKQFHSRRLQKNLAQLIQKKLIQRSYELERARVKPKIAICLKLKVKAEEALLRINPRAVKQAELVRYLSQNPQPVTVAELKHDRIYSIQAVKALVTSGLIETVEIHIDRDPIPHRNISLSFPLSLTPAQKNAYQTICQSLPVAGGKAVAPGIFLLHGVTGSGKTEVYLQALEEAVRRGKRGIVLVPEIAMTPQMIERFVSRFPGRVAILHSALSLGERFDEWWRIKKGEFDIVIGPRSAIFAPQPDLGLIVIDEEHEWTYKQADSPRYHTREVALKIAELTGAAVVLGSATPDVESYFRAQNREFRLIEMPQRVTPGEDSPLPEVEIVDLRSELKAGNLSLFSRSLYSSILKALDQQEQIILFLNRRGGASFVECRSCGWVIRCKRCQMPLSYHFNEERLICHQCNYQIPVPQVCPHCHSQRIKYLGVGTEALELEGARTFPQARILRWDSDAIRERGQTHEKIFTAFKAGKADILIGTQMIAKGLDLPRVTLVGVISADVALNLPDFRAGERTFQLLSQVAGRAGRGPAGGRVIIQTYFPEHYAIRAAAQHDYPAFYQKEIAYRRDLHNPPYSRLARLIYTHSSDDLCRTEVERMKRILLGEKDARGRVEVSLVGPAPAYIHRLRGCFRWQIILRASDPSKFLSPIPFPRGWSVDIDPLGI